MSTQSDTMKSAIAQLAAALEAVERAAGAKADHASIAVGLYGAPLPVCLAWAQEGGRIAVRTSSVSLPTGDARVHVVASPRAEDVSAFWTELDAAALGRVMDSVNPGLRRALVEADRETTVAVVREAA